MPKKHLPASEAAAAVQTFDIEHFIDSATRQLTPAQALYVTELENGISRGDVPAQQKQALTGLANF